MCPHTPGPERICCGAVENTGAQDRGHIKGANILGVTAADSLYIGEVRQLFEAKTANTMARTRATLKRPVRRLTQSELDNFLDKAADILRGNVDHSEFRGYVFALLFFKRIGDIYLEEIRNLAESLGDAELA